MIQESQTGYVTQDVAPTLRTMTPRTTLPWQATARRRRWILKRYGRGPRKKPPDPPPPPKRISDHPLLQKKLRQPRRSTHTILYKRSFQPPHLNICIVPFKYNQILLIPRQHHQLSVHRLHRPSPQLSHGFVNNSNSSCYPMAHL